MSENATAAESTVKPVEGQKLRTTELRVGEKVIKTGEQTKVRRSNGDFESDWTLSSIGKAFAVVEKNNPDSGLFRKVIPLNEFRSNQIDNVAQADPKDLGIWIRRWKEGFKELQSRGHVNDVKEGFVDNFNWQQVRYGEPLKGRSEQMYRGYLMVEPEQIPLALTLLSSTAEIRRLQGKTTEFKWLMNTEEPGFVDKILRGEEYKPNGIGEYSYLAPDDPRIAIYGDELSEVQEILRSLAQHTQWQQIEDQRRLKFKGDPPRRPGTNSYIDEKGLEWKSINFNNVPGYSETQVKDPYWRAQKIGTPTKALK